MTQPEFDDNDEYSNDGPPQDQDGQRNSGGRNWKNLREKSEKYDALLPEHEQLRRENAFLKAGIPDTPQGRLLQKAYDGEPTVEAIRQFAQEHGVIESESDVPADELAAMSRADAASAGGSYTPQKAPDMNAALRGAFGR